MTDQAAGGTAGASQSALFMVILPMVYRLIFLVLLFAGAIAVVRLALLPLAREIKGTDTTFNFSFGVNISLALNVALAVALGVSEVDRRGAKKELKRKRTR